MKFVSGGSIDGLWYEIRRPCVYLMLDHILKEMQQFLIYWLNEAQLRYFEMILLNIDLKCN